MFDTLNNFKKIDSKDVTTQMDDFEHGPLIDMLLPINLWYSGLAYM